MSRRRIIVGLVLVAAAVGTAAPAMAEDDGSKVCVMMTNDRNNPGESPLCVWVPINKAG